MSVSEKYKISSSSSISTADDDAINELQYMTNKAIGFWKSNPDEAFEIFNEVIQREQGKSHQDCILSLKSCKFLLLMSLSAKHLDAHLIKEYSDYFSFLINYQPKEEREKIINEVIEAVMNSKSYELYDVILPKLLKQLSTLNLMEFCTIQMKLCKQYYLCNNAQCLLQTINNVEEFLEYPTQLEQGNKIYLEVQLLVYRLLYYQLIDNYNEIPFIYMKLANVRIQLFEPFIQGVIYLAIGKEKALEKKYKESREILMKACSCFQGEYNKQAKQALIYGLTVSILENGKQNIFEDQRTKLFQNDHDIQTIQILKLSYDTNKIDIFRNIMNSNIFKQDQFLKQLRHRLFKAFKESQLQRILRCIAFSGVMIKDLISIKK